LESTSPAQRHAAHVQDLQLQGRCRKVGAPDRVRNGPRAVSPPSRCGKTTFEELAERFKSDYAPHHYRGDAWKHKLKRLTESMGKYSLAAISPGLITKYRDDRLTQPDPRFKKSAETAPRISPATVKTEIDMLSKVLDVAVKEFGITLPNGNPVSGVRKPRGDSKRERRLVDDEELRLLAECDASGNLGWG